jgi:hypothetical protein
VDWGDSTYVIHCDGSGTQNFIILFYSDSYRVGKFYQKYYFYFNNVDMCLWFVQLSNSLAQDYIRADFQRADALF